MRLPFHGRFWWRVSPYCAARFKKRDAVAAMLLERGAKVDFFSRVFLGETDAARQRLRDDPGLATQEKPQHDPNVRATALHYAVSPGHGALVEMLLEHGADPRPYGEWLIRFCIWRNRSDILETLLDAGVDAASAEPPRAGVADPRIVEVLERHGMAVDPDRAEGGWPPLVFHCRGDRGGDLQRVRRLLDAGAEVNVRNHKAQTALHCAAKAGFVAIAALLVERGAKVDAEDRDGRHAARRCLAFDDQGRTKAARRGSAALAVRRGSAAVRPQGALAARHRRPQAQCPRVARLPGGWLTDISEPRAVCANLKLL